MKSGNHSQSIDVNTHGNQAWNAFYFDENMYDMDYLAASRWTTEHKMVAVNNTTSSLYFPITPA